MNKQQAHIHAKQLSERPDLDGELIYVVSDMGSYDAATESDLQTFYNGLHDCDLVALYVNGENYE